MEKLTILFEELKREVSLFEGYPFNLSNPIKSFWWVWWGETYEKDYKFIKKKGWEDKRISIKNKNGGREWAKVAW